MDVLQALLVCYAVLLALSSAVSLKLYLLYRTKPFFLLMLVWPLTLVNFVLQGLFVESPLGSALSFSTYFMAALCLSNIICIVAGISLSFKWKPYLAIYCIAIALSLILHAFDGSFLVITMPIACAIATPQIYVAVIKLSKFRNKGPELSNVFAVALLLNGLHFLDYPLLRPYPDAAIYGFSLVLVITILFSLLLPVILSNHSNKLLNKRLIEEMEQTQKLAKVKSDFLANMSHEIRTPINGIRGLNDLLRATQLSSEQQRYCDIAHKSIDHLTNLVSDILSLSHLESGKVVLHPEKVQLDTIQTDLREYYSLSGVLDNKELKLSIDSLAHQTVVIDRGKVMQVLFNLTNNAIKYTTGNTIKVSFDIQTNDNSHLEDQLYISIFDNGEGIAKTSQENIFSEFNQLTPGKGGVGLGLSIVSRLVGAMGGAVHLKSSKVDGTTFECYIPVKYSLEEKSLPNDLVAQHCPTPTRSNRPSHVLAVEDDPTSQMILSAVFKKEGIIGTVVGTAEQALENLLQSDFDLIITDINLPGISGLELLKEIRKNDPCIPVVVQSAFAFEEDLEQAKLAGATSYLRKPVTYKNIVDACLLNGIQTKSSSRNSA